MICKMKTEDINQVVEIHTTSWNSNEFSVKLGRSYLRLFYRCIVEFPESEGYISRDKNNKIIAYATGFLNYEKFNANFKRRFFVQLMFIVLIRLLKLKLSLPDIGGMLQDGEKTKNLKYPMFHLGALAIANQHKSTVQGLSAMIMLIKEVHKAIADNGGKGCWGACDENNQAMRKLFECMGYQLIDSIRLAKKSITIYEKLF